jgi:hypothetical protein
LLELEAGVDIHAFDNELGTKDVGELGTVSVTTTSRLFLVVVKVLAVQKEESEENKVRYSDNR